MLNEGAFRFRPCFAIATRESRMNPFAFRTVASQLESINFENFASFVVE